MASSIRIRTARLLQPAILSEAGGIEVAFHRTAARGAALSWRHAASAQSLASAAGCAVVGAAELVCGVSLAGSRLGRSLLKSLHR